MRVILDLIRHLSAAGWPFFGLLSLACFAGWYRLVSPRPVRLLLYKPVQQFPTLAVWDERAATAVAEFADWGLPLGNNGELVRYEAAMGPDGRICWAGGTDAHLQQVRIDAEDYVLKILPKAGDPRITAAYRASRMARSTSDVLERHLCPMRLLPQAISVMDENAEQRWTDVIVAPLQREMILDFIVRNLQEKSPEVGLRLLAQKFRRMVADFHRLGWIYGDYHVGNIAVGEHCSPVLIDLDTFSHVSQPAAALATLGHAGFQLPYRRTRRKLFARHVKKLDYFSEWVIYTSLMAYAILGKSLDAPSTEDEFLLFDEDNLREENLGVQGNPLEKLWLSEHPLLENMAIYIQASCASNFDLKMLAPLEAIFTEEEFTAWETDAEPWRRRIQFAASQP